MGNRNDTRSLALRPGPNNVDSGSPQWRSSLVFKAHSPLDSHIGPTRSSDSGNDSNTDRLIVRSLPRHFILAERPKKVKLSEIEIQEDSTRKFEWLLQHDTPEGLTELVECGLKLISQKWTTLILYTDFIPSDIGRRRSTQWKGRLSIVYILAKICMAYWHAYSSGVAQGYTVDASDVHGEWIPTLRQILQLGDTADSGEKEEIKLQEWWDGEI